MSGEQLKQQKPYFCAVHSHMTWHNVVRIVDAMRIVLYLVHWICITIRKKGSLRFFPTRWMAAATANICNFANTKLRIKYCLRRVQARIHSFSFSRFVISFFDQQLLAIWPHWVWKLCLFIFRRETETNEKKYAPHFYLLPKSDRNPLCSTFSPNILHTPSYLHFPF